MYAHELPALFAADGDTRGPRSGARQVEKGMVNPLGPDEASNDEDEGDGKWD